MFNSKTASEAGKISKRGTAIGVELRSSLHQLVNYIINDLDYDSLNPSQKIKLLDVALKHSLPRLSIEKQVQGNEFPDEVEIQILNGDGELIRSHTNVINEK